jgi:DNA-binding HxlR family transcriptional regulator
VSPTGRTSERGSAAGAPAGGGRASKSSVVGTAPAKIPAPGRPVRGSDSGRPVMALLDLLGRRWTLRVIWELREQRLPFRAIQERCEGMSSSVLNQRLRELRAADIVELGTGGYRLSREGRRLLDAYGPLDDWAERWAARTPLPRRRQGQRGQSPG